MNGKLKKALPLLGALVFLMVGAALAVPAINLNVQPIGGGGNSNVKVATTSAAVNWQFDSTNPWVITGASITLDQGPGVAGNLDLYITLDNGTVIHKTASVDASGTSVTISGLNIDLTKNAITRVAVVVAGKKVTA